MSTILDALRKIERDKRQQESGNARREVVEPAPPPANRRLRLIALLAAGSVGILAGATLAIWSGGPHPDEELQVAPRPRLARPAASPAIQHPPPAAAPGTEKTSALSMQDSDSRSRSLDRSQRRRYLRAAEEGASPSGASESPRLRSEPEEINAHLDEQPIGHQPLAKVTPVGNSKASATDQPRAPASPPSRSELAVEGEAATPTDRQPPPVVQQPTANLAESPPEIAPPATGSEEALTYDKKAEEQEQPTKLVDTGRSPPGVPKIALGMLQWSPEPSRRFAFISVDGGPFQKLREGERAQSLAITRIGKDSVTFKYETTLFVIRPRY